MQAYSMDLRVRVMADVDAGLGTKAAAQKYRVSPDWVRKLKRFRRQTGSFAARKQPRVTRDQTRSRTAALATVGRAAARCHPLRAAPGLGSFGRVGNGLAGAAEIADHLQKKVIHAAEQQRPDVQARRAAWVNEQPAWVSRSSRLYR